MLLPPRANSEIHVAVFSSRNDNILQSTVQKHMCVIAHWHVHVAEEFPVFDMMMHDDA